MRVLDTSEVMRRTGLGRTTIWRFERNGDFPRRRKLGANRVDWIESEVDDWIDSRPRVGTEDGDETA